jgi:galactokinase
LCGAKNVMACEIKGLRTVGSWMELLNDTSSGFHRRLDETCGGDKDSKAEAVQMCLQALEAFAREYGRQRSVIIVRSTGRANLLGTHIDHRGGSVNPICIKHMWLVAEPRDDDLVLANDVESEQFPEEEFRISECLPADNKIQDWDAWCHDEFEQRKYDPLVTWSNYVRAAVLYFQHLNTADDGSFAPALRGMNVLVYGNVPRAAGLASSSALVMAVAEAVMRINGLTVERSELAEHCGYAEWYVGTRGGCSDHAAIIFGQPNAMLHITAFPTTVETVRFPAGHSIVLANSLIEAKKQRGARNIFNSRVAAYVFGLMMIRKNFPQYAGQLKHLRDVNPRRLGVDDAEIYYMVRSLPACASRADIVRLLSDQELQIRRLFRSHDEPQEGYRIRQVCLYGISECIRADKAVECLQAGDVETFGELISMSHDGDRLTKLVGTKRQPTDNSYPDARIDALIGDLESGNPERMERARLWRQGGGYNMSLPELDMLVDIALGAPGVIGAGLVGAGMGGCIAVVVKDEHARQVIENLAEQYYRPCDLPVGAEVVTAVGGLRTIDV